MNTKGIALNCNHCGAALNVPGGTRFVTCAQCKSQLEVRRGDSAFFTAVLKQARESTRAVAVDLELVRIHNEIQLLDRAWDTACKRHLQRDRNGEYLEPGSALKYVTLSIIVALGIAVVFAGMAAGSVPGSMAGVIGAALGLFFIWRETKARAEYDRAFNSYQKKRQSLLLSLKEAGKP